MSAQFDLFGAPSPVVNPDGSVKGSTVIYAPKGPPLEYAPLATNPFRGCGHSCTYCPVPITTHQDRAEFNAGAILRPNYLANLRRDAALYQAAGISEQVLIAFITDPYHPADTTPTRAAIEMLIEYGLGVCVLSKGGARALRDVDPFRPDRDAYATTLTFEEVGARHAVAGRPNRHAQGVPRRRNSHVGELGAGGRRRGEPRRGDPLVRRPLHGRAHELSDAADRLARLHALACGRRRSARVRTRSLEVEESVQ
jgi:hypothetical protein